MNIYSQFWKPVPFCAWKNLQPNTTVCAREHFHTSDICILHLSVSLMTLQMIGSAQAHKQKVTFYIRTVFITFTFTLLIRQHVTFVWLFVNRKFFLRWMCKRLINPDGKICNLDGLQIFPSCVCMCESLSLSLYRSLSLSHVNLTFFTIISDHLVSYSNVYIAPESSMA